MIHKSKYTVNLSPSRGSTEVNLAQYETGRQIEFTLIDNDAVYIPTGTTVTINGTKPDGNVYSAEGTVDPETRTASFDEDDQLTAISGKWPAKLKLIHAGEVLFTSRLLFAVDADVVDPEAVPSDSQIDGYIAEARHYAEEAKSEAYGAPLVARTAAEMTDRSRVYVYIGREEGWDPGYWYYFDGTEWTLGGSYNAIDETLEEVGKAADAKATGDALNTKVDKVEGFGLSSNDFTTAEKEKLAGIAQGATRVIVDSAISGTSTNPIQNGIVKAYIDAGDETDPSLQIPGKSADAQVTGDRIANAVSEYRDLIETERQARTSAVSAEATLRSQGITAERNARTSAINQERLAREQAITTEQTAREHAINTERAAREAAIAELQGQIDGNITSFFYNYNPTTANAPANGWTTDAIRNIHLGDLFYNTSTGHMWRWMKNGNGGYLWQRVSDTDVTKALSDIRALQESLEYVNETLELKADKSELPTNVSELTNDANYATIEEVSEAVSVVIDPTLKVSGKAADAKATGDALSNKVDKIAGRQLSENNYTTYEREKLAGISSGATRVIVDYQMNESSANPVQSRIIKKYVDDNIAALDSVYAKPEDIPEPIDVKINGTSIVEDGVANIPVASGDAPGVVEIYPNYGIGIYNNKLMINAASSANIKAGNDSTKAISTYRQHESVFYGLSKAAGVDMASSNNPIGTYTDEAKSAIRDMLGIQFSSQQFEKIVDYTVPETAESVTVDTDLENNPFELVAAIIILKTGMPTQTTSKFVSASLLDQNNIFRTAPTLSVLSSNPEDTWLVYGFFSIGGLPFIVGKASANGNAQSVQWATPARSSGLTRIDYITGVRFSQHSQTATLIPKDAVIQIYGVRGRQLLDIPESSDLTLITTAEIDAMFE